MIVEFTDGVNTISKTAELVAGVWTLDDTDISSLNDGTITVLATVLDNAGNTKTVNDTLVLDTLNPNAPIILNIIDINSDLNQIVINGSGDEVGNIIKVYDSLNNLIGTSLVLADNTWSLNISSLNNEIRHSLTAVELDSSFNISDDSNIVNIIKSTNSSLLTLNNDDYVFTGSANDFIIIDSDNINDELIVDGGEGNDTVSFRSLNDSININLNDSIHNVGNDKIEFRNIENIYGSETSDDNITGDSNDNFLYGGRGNDTLRGGAGDDILLGDQGSLLEDNNDDLLYGEEGKDTLIGGHGDDTLYGGKDNDILHGQRGDDLLIGGEGDDIIRGDGGIDTAVFSGNLSDYSFTINATMNISSVDNRLSGDDGNDNLINVEYFQFANRLVSTSLLNSDSIALLSTSDSGSSSSDHITNDTSPTFKVDISPFIEYGCIVNIYSNGIKVGEHTVTTSDVTNTYVNVTVNEFTSDGIYLMSSSISNLLGFEGSSSSALSVQIDTNADTDNNFEVSVLSSDELVNASESDDISLALSGIDSDAKSINIQFSDGTNTVSTSASLVSGNWIVSDSNISSLNDGNILVTATVIDNAGNSKIVSDTLLLDQSASDPVLLKNISITDVNGDYSSVIMSGQNSEIGSTITLYDEDNNIIGTSIVVSPGIWTIDISSLPNTPIDENEFFKITETDFTGNVSTISESIQYLRYSWPDAETEPSDDFNIAGDGNDTLLVESDDSNDSLFVDLGNGDDILEFTGNKEDYTITHNLDGTITILESPSSDSNADGIGDKIIAKNVEVLEFANGTILTNTLASPIAFDLNNDGQIGVSGETSSINKDLNVNIGKTVSFDIDADGTKDKIEWFKANEDGILIDNRDGKAISSMDGSRLFGDEGGKYNDGYEKLALLDENKDGKISKEELDGLNLWVDDGDALLEKGELKTLEELGIKSISTIKKEIIDEEGRIHLQSFVEIEDGTKILSEDVWFLKDNEEDINLSNIDNERIYLENTNKDTHNINFNEILNPKDEYNELVILDNKDDKLILEGGIKSSNNEDGKWLIQGTKDDGEGNIYNVYQSTDTNSIVKLLIDEDIDRNHI